MYIKDLQTGEVRKYGTDRHDSLVISEDGRTLSYYNLQNGDGSKCGEYRFCDAEGKIPADLKDNHGEDYFNIGGWGEPRFLAHSDGSIEQINEPKTGHWIDYKDEHECSQCRETIYVNRDVWEEEPYDYCPNCGARMESEEGI